MSDKLKQVYEKAAGDSQFAKELLFGGVIPTCEKAGISLNKSEGKILEDAMKTIREHFLEKLYVVSTGPEVLWQIGCGGCIA
jgi:hypothetical protein